MSKVDQKLITTAHQYFSVQCFNDTWNYIDKKERTDEENEKMIELAMASLWHWTQREDCTQQNLSIGYWQVSRVYALAGQAGNAVRYGNLCLEVSQGEDIPAFCVGYAYEALARAEFVAGNKTASAAHLKKANEAAEKVGKKDDRQMLLDDLATIK